MPPIKHSCKEKVEAVEAALAQVLPPATVVGPLLIVEANPARHLPPIRMAAVVVICRGKICFRASMPNNKMKCVMSVMILLDLFLPI